MRKMFSKNQIGEIVKQGIENGTIPSGTKLYKHYYHDDNEYPKYMLKFVCTSKTPLTAEQVKEKFNNCEILSLLAYNDDNLGAWCTPLGDMTASENAISFKGYDGGVIETESISFDHVTVQEVSEL